MKKLYTISLSVLLGITMANAAPARFVSARGTASLTGAVKAPATEVWRPASLTEFIYIDGQWLELGSSQFTYDVRGNKTSERYNDDEDFYVVDYTYDDYNQVLTRLEQAQTADGLEPLSRRTYTYDDILHTYAVKRVVEDYVDGAWKENNYSEYNTITRNTDGNITTIVKSLPLYKMIDGTLTMQIIPAYKSSWTYGADGKAETFEYYAYSSEDAQGNVVWDLHNDESYRQLVWEATDGQMTGSDMSEFVTGANRIKSATVYYENKLDGHFFVDYGTDGNYTIRQTAENPDEVWVLIERKATDANGSFTYTTKEYFEEGEHTATPTYTSTLVVTYNDHGDAVLEQLTEQMPGEPDAIQASKAEYTYDANGNTIEMITYFYDEEKADFIPESRTVYGAYIDAAGIESVNTDAADAAPVYYNLQGVRVDNPAKGRIYIRTCAGKASKVIL